MAMHMSASVLAYTTTTGRPTPTQKTATHLAAIAQMHTAAQFYTKGEIRQMEADEAASPRCEADAWDGTVCQVHLLADGKCPQPWYHLTY